MANSASERLKTPLAFVTGTSLSISAGKSSFSIPAERECTLTASRSECHRRHFFQECPCRDDHHAGSSNLPDCTNGNLPGGPSACSSCSLWGWIHGGKALSGLLFREVEHSSRRTTRLDDRLVDIFGCGGYLCFHGSLC